MSAARVQAYSATARFLHWLTVLAVFAMVPAGLAMLRVGPGALQNFLFDFHRSMGVALFCVTIIRLIYRFMNPPAPLPDDIPAIQRFAAWTVHALLYVILLATPIIGWIGTSAFGAPIRVFGLFTLPAIVAKDKAMADLFLGLHQWIGWILIAALSVHIAAALYHHLVRQDDVLVRMTRG